MEGLKTLMIPIGGSLAEKGDKQVNGNEIKRYIIKEKELAI